MGVDVSLVSAFEHLHADRSLAKLQNPASREREAVVDITFDASDSYTTGGQTVNFNKIRKFTQVYFCHFLGPVAGFVCEYVPAAGNDAATGKIKIYGSGAAAGDKLDEIPASQTAHRGTVRAVIRGI